MHTTNLENAQLDLPERYTRLLQDLSSQQWGPDVNFESAFPRIERRRLIAEYNLRQALQKYWSRKDPNALRPLDLLFEFRTYAEETFKATGSECVGLFHDSRSYKSFLYVIEEWVVTELLPYRETAEQRLVRQFELMESISSLVERFEPCDQIFRDAKPQVADDIEELRKSKLEMDQLQASVSPSQWQQVLQSVSRTFEERIIGLRETITEFETRIEDLRDTNFSDPSGGDWERIVDDSLTEVIRMQEGGLLAASSGAPLRVALRKEANRISVTEYLLAALEQLRAPHLAAWWGRSAESPATDKQTLNLKSGDERTLAATAREPANRRLSGGHLSDRDQRIHMSIGEERFCTLTNAEIMKEAGVKKRLRHDFQLEPGDAAKRCLDRIRHAKGYPLSRKITEKRSTRQ